MTAYEVRGIGFTSRSTDGDFSLNPSNVCQGKPPVGNEPAALRPRLVARLRLQASPVRRSLRGARRGSARLVTLGGENDARSPDTRQSTRGVWWGDDWARAFLTTGSDAEDSRLGFCVLGVRGGGGGVGVLGVLGVTAGRTGRNCWRTYRL